MNGILLVSSLCDVFSAVSRSLSTTLERSLNVNALGHLGWVSATLDENRHEQARHASQAGECTTLDTNPRTQIYQAS